MINKEQVLEYFPQSEFNKSVHKVVKQYIPVSIENVSSYVMDDIDDEATLHSVLEKTLRAVENFYKKINYDEAMKEAYNYDSFIEFVTEDKYAFFEFFSLYLKEDNYTYVRESFINSLYFLSVKYP